MADAPAARTGATCYSLSDTPMTHLLVRILNPLQPAIETARTYDLSKLERDAAAVWTVAGPPVDGLCRVHRNLFNLALYLRRASRLHMAEMVQTPTGPFEEIPLCDHFGKHKIMFLQVEGDLFFGVAGELQEPDVRHHHQQCAGGDLQAQTHARDGFDRDARVRTVCRPHACVRRTRDPVRRQTGIAAPTLSIRPGRARRAGKYL